MNKVLILSGDPLFREKNMGALAEAGFEVDTVPNYLEGIKKVDGNGITAIIIDEDLPDMDIYQACTHIRQYFETPIILVASEADEKIWAKVEDLGFDFYLRKPVSPRELVARVKAVLRRVPEAKGRKKEEYPPKPEIKPTPTSIEITPTTQAKVAALHPYGQGIAGTTGAQSPTQVEIQRPVPPTPLHTPSKTEVASLPNVPIQTTVPIAQSPSTSHSARAMKLISGILRGKISEINPVIDMSEKDSFAYPEADRILETTGRETRKALEALAEEDTLQRRPSTPVVKYRDLKTGRIFPAEALQEIRLHSYTFNEAKRKRLEIELEPKMKLLEFLKSRGYEVTEGAVVKGRSGAEHKFDLYARRDDGVVSQTLAVAIMVAEDGEIGFDRVSLFDSKANDAGIHDKFIVALSKLNSAALQFARQQNIIVFEANDLNTLFLTKPKPF